jgi:hypothetical protein
MLTSSAYVKVQYSTSSSKFSTNQDELMGISSPCFTVATSLSFGSVTHNPDHGFM